VLGSAYNASFPSKDYIVRLAQATIKKNDGAIQDSTRLHISEDQDVHQDCCENLRSHMAQLMKCDQLGLSI